MWDSLFQKLYKEWPVIKKVPLVFSVAVLLVGALIWFVMYQGFRTVMEMKNDYIDSLEKKIATLSELKTEPDVPYINSGATTHGVALFLQFTDERTTPKEIRQTNVRFWRALSSPSIAVDGEDKAKQAIRLFSVPPRWIVFVYFEKPAIYRQMFARCSSESLQCTIDDHNDRFAIVTVVGDVSRATLEVSVVP